MTMTFKELIRHLENSRMFTDREVHSIVKATGTATIGNAIIACGLIGIELHGSDIDNLIAISS